MISSAVYDHRRAAIGYLSGGLRYEVLKRAGYAANYAGLQQMREPLKSTTFFRENTEARTT
jgi:hypothetical protein